MQKHQNSGSFSQETAYRNSRLQDSSSKIIFEDNLLCSQFLRDYVDLEAFKNVRAEDIEDVSSQFVSLFEEERNADRIKKVVINSKAPYFLISLIEHKSQVDYNICMQIFRYMVCIWESYEKEMEKLHPGISKTVGFRYPPVIPIVYYEGRSRWTAPLNFKSRIVNGDSFHPYIPDFTYYPVPVHQYSNEELLDTGDEISLVMLINKLQDDKDFTEFKKLPANRLDAMLHNSPKYLREIIANVFLAFMLKAKVPMNEAIELSDKLKEKQMGQLFEHIDINLNMEEVREQVRTQVTELVTAQVTAQVTEQVTAQVTEQVTEQVTAQVTEQVTEQAIKALTLTCQKLGTTKEFTALQLTEFYALPKEQAYEKISLYWKD